MKGFTPVRTARVIAGCIALLGMFFLFIERVLATVLQMASQGVQMGLARYDNFTGRMAAQNFAEDKQLLSLLHDVEKMLPSADTALTVLLVLAIVFLAIALIGLALPRQFGHVLVAVKLLRWQECSENVDGEGGQSEKPGLSAGQKKVASIAGVLFLAIVIVGLCISSCAEKIAEASLAESIDTMQSHALEFIQGQKQYFGAKKVVGTAKAMNMADSLEDKNFSYRIKGSRFEAVSKVQLGKCAAGTKWSVSASTKGFFTKDLVLYRALPKDTACAKLTPEFKQLGRNKQ